MPVWVCWAWDRPELGLTNWERGRLLGRSGFLSGDVRGAAAETGILVGIVVIVVAIQFRMMTSGKSE